MTATSRTALVGAVLVVFLALALSASALLGSQDPRSDAPRGGPPAAVGARAASASPQASEASVVSPAPAPSSPAAPAVPPTPALARLAGRVVAIDPGHNGRNARHPEQISRQVDAGGFLKDCNTTGAATDGGHSESAINWSVAGLLRQRLEALGATVVLTRPDDAGWGPCINERAAIANRAGADLLLSVHADGASASARGFHVIAPGPLPGYTDDILEPSDRLAGHVRDSLREVAGLIPATYVGVDGLDRRTDLGTLNRADVPAVLVECGNLRNAADAELLSDPAGQARVADALAAAVLRFLPA